MNKINFSLALAIGTIANSLCAMDLPCFAIVTSYREAPWDRQNAPNAFDEALSTRAKHCGTLVTLDYEDKKLHLMGCSKDRICSVSADGCMFATTDLLDGEWVLSIIDKQPSVKFSVRLPSRPLHIALASEAPLAAMVSHEDPDMVTLVNVVTEDYYQSYSCVETLCAIALSGDAKMLALCRPMPKISSDSTASLLSSSSDSELDNDFKEILEKVSYALNDTTVTPIECSLITLLDLGAQEVKAEFTVAGKVVGLTLGNNVMVELEKGSQREIKTFALFEEDSVNGEQRDFLLGLSEAIDTTRVELNKSVAFLPTARQLATFRSLKLGQQQKLMENIIFIVPK